MPGRSYNDPKERIFSLIRYLVGCFVALATTTFYQAERTLLLWLVADARRNADGSHSTISCNHFFEEASTLTKISEAVSTQKFQESYGNMIPFNFDLKTKMGSDKIF